MSRLPHEVISHQRRLPRRLSSGTASRITGVHLNYIPGSYRPHVAPGDISAEEQAFLEVRSAWNEEEGGYHHQQRTRPATLAFGLNDSPVGLAAWILEKFRAWSDCGGDLDGRLPRDWPLTNVTLYWVMGTIGSSARLYREAARTPLQFAPGERLEVPTAIARFPREILSPPRSWVERVYPVVRWSEMARGGHFAALEEPRLLADDIRAFFRPLRS